MLTGSFFSGSFCVASWLNGFSRVAGVEALSVAPSVVAGGVDDELAPF